MELALDWFGPFRLFQLPTMPMDASVMASKPDTTPKVMAYHEPQLSRPQVIIEQYVQYEQSMKA